jgi:arylsulfatase A-like enzyme
LRSTPFLRAFVVVPVSFGLAVGLAVAGALAYLRASTDSILELSRDYGWMTPAAVALAALLASLALGLVSRVWRRAASAGAILFVPLLVVLLELLLRIPRLHHAAVLLLALGIAFQLSRMLAPRADRVMALAARSLPWLALVVAIIAVGPRGARWLRERRALAALASPPAGAPNVILISLDAVRAANLSVYGYARPTTPRLEGLARTGAVFETALSTASWTLPSHASMLTGRWHHELSVGYEEPLDRTFPTVAEYLGSKGYATGGVVANLRYCGYETGLDRGFLHYHDYPVTAGQVLATSKLWRTALNNFRLRRLIRNDQHLVRKSAEEVNRAALDWVDRAGSRPFFLFLNYFDAHEPYLPPAPFDRQFGPGRAHGKLSPLHRWLWEPAVGHGNMGPAQIEEEMAAYDGAIRYLDQEVGALLDQLERRGKLGNTLIVITADHGEEFAEHRLFEHGYSLYRPSVRVPLIVVKPGSVPAGARVAGAASLRDLPATIVELAGVGAGSPFPGRSLSRYWGPESAPAEEPILSEVRHATGQPDWFPVSRGDLIAATYGGLRYIRNSGGGEELFDLAGDPWERNDLIAKPELRPALDGLRRMVDSLVPPRTVTP